MQLIFCRHDDCGKPFESEAGFRPSICPACQRVAAWATDADAPKISATLLAFTVNDKRFLKSIRILAV